MVTTNPPELSVGLAKVNYGFYIIIITLDLRDGEEL